MIVVACPSCAHALRVTGDLREMETLVGAASDFWPDKYRCFSCGEPAHAVLGPEVSEVAARMLTYVDVTPQEAFAALNGLGVPEERTCCPEVLIPLFEQQGIKVQGHTGMSGKTFRVDALEFPDGSKIFFGISPQGAVIYRVTRRHSYLQNLERTDVA